MLLPPEDIRMKTQVLRECLLKALEHNEPLRNTDKRQRDLILIYRDPL